MVMATPADATVQLVSETKGHVPQLRTFAFVPPKLDEAIYLAQMKEKFELGGAVCEDGSYGHHHRLRAQVGEDVYVFDHYQKYASDGSSSLTVSRTRKDPNSGEPREDQLVKMELNFAGGYHPESPSFPHIHVSNVIIINQTCPDSTLEQILRNITPQGLVVRPVP